MNAPHDATWGPTRDNVELHDHAVVIFQDTDDLKPHLKTFLAEGIRKGELMVFVHSFAHEDEAWDLLRRAWGSDARALGTQVVVVSLYTDAFEAGAARIDYARVSTVVDELTKTATLASRKGVRIFVDASRRYFAAARTKEWFEFESWLGRRLHAQVGLVCAYQADDIARPEILADALRTHAYRFDARPRARN